MISTNESVYDFDSFLAVTSSDCCLAFAATRTTLNINVLMPLSESISLSQRFFYLSLSFNLMCKWVLNQIDFFQINQLPFFVALSVQTLESTIGTCFTKLFTAVINGRGSAVNRVLDGSTYPG